MILNLSSSPDVAIGSCRPAQSRDHPTPEGLETAADWKQGRLASISVGTVGQSSQPRQLPRRGENSCRIILERATGVSFIDLALTRTSVDVRLFIVLVERSSFSISV